MSTEAQRIRHRLYMREYCKTEKYRKSNREKQARYRAKYPEKKKAHDRNQHLPIGDKCVECGSKERLHRHHPNYEERDNVITLCAICHSAVHRKQAGDLS